MMDRSKHQDRAAAIAAASRQPLQRTPQRLSVTLSWSLYRRLQERSDQEGRSMSNLAAFLLERACPEDDQTPQV